MRSSSSSDMGAFLPDMSVPNVGPSTTCEGCIGVARPWLPTGVAAGAWSHRDLFGAPSGAAPGTGVWSQRDRFDFESAVSGPGVDSLETSHLFFRFRVDTSTVDPASAFSLSDS